MTTITDWASLVEVIQPFLVSQHPIQALKDAGHTLGGELGAALDDSAPSRVQEALVSLSEELRRQYGPPPPIRLSLGKNRPSVSSRAGGYHAVGSADLGFLNEILAELWRVRTIPNSFDQSLVNDHLITVNDLRAACTGVPQDATGAVLFINAPAASATGSSSAQTVHFDIGFQLLLNSSAPTSIQGTVGAELPLDFEVVFLPKDRNDPNSMLVPWVRLRQGAIGDLTAVVTVDAGSRIQPTGGGLAVLNERFGSALRALLIYLIYDRRHLLIPGQIEVGDPFPNSRVIVHSVGAVTVRVPLVFRDFLIVGINVGDEVSGDPAALAVEEYPWGPENLHVVMDQGFGTDALAAVISSGDMAAFLNRIVARHSLGLSLQPIVVNGGSVTFDGKLVVSFDCTWQGACNFGTDLSFTATVTASPTIVDGRLVMATSGVDVNLDTWDEIKCVLLTIPGFGTLATLAVEAFVQTYPFLAPKELSYSVGIATDPLPGSERVVQIEVDEAFMGLATLRADGRAHVVDDTFRTFVYLRLQEGPTEMLAEPLVGATVELIQVHDAAPSPPTGDTDTFRGKFEIVTQTTYYPVPDSSIAVGTTDSAGFLRFAVFCPATAGILTTTTTTTNIDLGTSSSTTVHDVINESGTELAITVTDAGGTRMTTRQVVATDIVNRRLGTHDHPFVVLLRRPLGPIAGTT